MFEKRDENLWARKNHKMEHKFHLNAFCMFWNGISFSEQTLIIWRENDYFTRCLEFVQGKSWMNRGNRTDFTFSTCLRGCNDNTLTALNWTRSGNDQMSWIIEGQMLLENFLDWVDRQFSAIKEIGTNGNLMIFQFSFLNKHQRGIHLTIMILLEQ